jgi:GT2 family glycosyltransferase
VPAAPVEVEALSGGCVLVRRDILELLAGWDEDYFLHVEDLDLCHRCRLAGYRLLFVPAAVAVHVKGASSAGRPVFVEWHKHRGLWRYFRKFESSQRNVLTRIGVWGAIWAHFFVVMVKRRF